MTVTVITDSAAALPGDLAERYGIEVVPLWLHIGDDSYRDGELTLDEVVARFDEPISTAAPSPGEFAAAIDAASSSGPVVVLTVAATVSSTYESAVVAARSFGASVAVVDSDAAAGAQGLVVLHAAETAAAGANLDEVIAEARTASDQVRLMATVPNLDRLARSGRVPKTAMRIGNRVGAQPLFEFRRGRPRPARPAFSRDAAFDRIVDRCASGMSGEGGGIGRLGSGGRVGAVGRGREGTGRGSLHVAVLHALDPAAAEQLSDRVDKLNPASCFVGPFSTVMVAHTGVGLAGLAWWRS